MIPTISENTKKKIIEFVDMNELDYTPIDNSITKFSLVSYDKMVFYVYENDNNLIVAKYDKNKDKINDPGSMAYEYFSYDNINKLLEDLSIYDKSLSKSYWNFIGDDMDMGVIFSKYNEEWYSDFVDKNWEIVNSDRINYIKYENSNYRPELKSPYNTLHEVSPFNHFPEYTKVEKLYIEIHPISCEDKNETYLLKMLINNEDIFKEYINYAVWSKKGLKLLIESIFKDMERFKI